MAQLLANSTIGDKQIASEEFVNDKVKTDVPVNAKFTDTTYNEISEAEIDTGTASTLRTITARRITYILSKAQTLINSAISALTKSSVGLSNVDNVKQASKTEFDTHNSDSTRHITSSERTAWNAKGSSNLALGETSATAYRGDRGKIAYDHSQIAHAPANAQKNSDITKAEIEAKLTGEITTHTHGIYFENITVTDWIADSTYEDYGYRAEINCQGVTSQMFADVVFSPESAVIGLAPVCKTDTNKVTIYAVSDEEVTILTIKAQ